MQLVLVSTTPSYDKLFSSIIRLNLQNTDSPATYRKRNDTANLGDALRQEGLRYYYRKFHSRIILALILIQTQTA